jgi:hypothetical protein
MAWLVAHQPTLRDLFRFLLAMSRHFQGLSFYSFSFKKNQEKQSEIRKAKNIYSFIKSKKLCYSPEELPQMPK